MESPKKKQAQEAMETAFLSLLRKKPLEKISVTELCRKAGVNRSTFYAHYLDVYDLMDQVTNGFIRKLFRDIVALLGEPTIGLVSPNGHPLIIKALQTTLEDRDLCQLLVSTRSGISMKLVDEVCHWGIMRYEGFSENRNTHYADNYTMMIGGIMILWYEWICSDFAAPIETLAIEITRFIEDNIKRMWL